MDDDRVWCTATGLINGMRVHLRLTDEGLHLRSEAEPEDGGEQIVLSRIDGVKDQIGAWTGYVTITVDGEDRVISRVPKPEAKALVEALRAQLRHRPEPTAEPEAEPGAGVPPADSPLEELERLGRLHDSGVLTDEEFATAKATLLRRI